MNKRVNQFIYICVILLLTSAGLLAQDTMEEMTVYDLQDTIVVVADRYKLPLKNIGHTYEVVREEQIQAMAMHSALELVDVYFPSAFTVDKKILGYGVGPEGAGAINIRGQGGRPNTGMLVLLNGHPDFMGIFGHPLPDVYGMDNIQQMEILAGPASSVFGSQAMGGVINLKTAPDYNHLAKVSIKAGSKNTYNIGVRVAKKIKDHGVFFSARRASTDGHIAQSSFDSYQFQGGWQYQIRTGWQLSLQGRYVPYQFDDPARTGDPADLGTYAKIRRGTGELVLQNNDPSVSGSSQLYGNWGNHRFYDGFESRDFTYGFSTYQQISILDNLNLAVGGDLMSYGGRAENKLTPPGVVNDQSHQLTSAGLYGLALYNPFSKLSLKLGLRYQYTSLPVQKVSPVAGINYHLLPGLHLYANYQSGYRFPTLNELYLFPPSNADLKEENIVSVESGLRYYWTANNSIRLSVYRNQVENIIQIVRNPAPPPPVKYANSGEATQTGFEGQVNYRLFSWLDSQFSYSYLDPDNLTAYNPMHQVKYLLQVSSGAFQTGIFGKYIDQLYAENDKKSELSDYHLLNVMMAYRLSSWTVSLNLMNLLDRAYEAQPGYPAPRFHFVAGFEYQL